MKKLLVVMLSLCMMIGLTACGGGSSVLPTKTISTDEFITSLKKGLENDGKCQNYRKKKHNIMYLKATMLTI